MIQSYKALTDVNGTANKNILGNISGPTGKYIQLHLQTVAPGLVAGDLVTNSVCN